LDISNHYSITDEEIKYLPQSLLGLQLNNTRQLTSKIFEYLPPNLHYLTLEKSNLKSNQIPFQSMPKEIHFKDFNW